MASTADAAPAAQNDAPFFAKFSLVIAIFIVVAFAQFGLRGMVDYAHAPLWMHLHALIMLTWLALFVVQTRRAAAGNLAGHRKLGWISAYFAGAVVAMGCYAGIAAIRDHVVPPFFTAPYFLALTQVSPVVFGGLVYAAITRRTQTDYHRRLMAGSLIAITEPAFGRVLPMPLMIGWSEWVVLGFQLAMIAVIALHDRRTLGRIHPATATAGAIIAMTHVLVELSALNPTIIGIAQGFAGE